MRTLIFNVKNQIIERKAGCDFGGLVADTTGYLKARFLFSEDWNGCAKVVGFFSKNGKEFPPCVLSDDDTCMIPDEVLKYHEFKIRLYGRNNDYTITTRPIIIKQYGGVE